MRYRIERVRTDTGLGTGWCILNSVGDCLLEVGSWAIALRCVDYLIGRAS